MPAAQPAQPTTARWRGRDLLSLRGLSRAELVELLRWAATMQPRARPAPSDPRPTPTGRIIANLFFEDSTRTRLSFAIAAMRLGMTSVDLAASGSSVSKGESLADTARTVEAMGVDALVVRTQASGGSELIADAVACPVINAGDGRHEHPTQGLLDALTLCEALGRADFDLAGARVVIVGDIINSRVARSDIACLGTLGADIVCVGPAALAPVTLEPLGCTVSHDLDEYLVAADAVVMLRVQHERHGAPGAEGPRGGFAGLGSLRAYRAQYALTADRAQQLRPDAVVMHPGPINRGIEIDAAVADGPASLITTQVANGIATRMAVLGLVLAER